MGNHKCGSVTIALVSETFGFVMVFVDLPVSVILPGGDWRGRIYFPHLHRPMRIAAIASAPVIDGGCPWRTRSTKSWSWARQAPRRA
jgi:hypothetical protein